MLVLSAGHEGGNCLPTHLLQTHNKLIVCSPALQRSHTQKKNHLMWLIQSDMNF